MQASAVTFWLRWWSLIWLSIRFGTGDPAVPQTQGCTAACFPPELLKADCAMGEGEGCQLIVPRAEQGL